jgi:hypothetical protein
MSFTYTQDPEHNLTDRVRFLIGDTAVEEKLIADEEIVFALAKYSNNVNAACCILCEGLAAKFAKRAEVRVSNYNTNKDSLFDKYLKLAERFRSKGNSASAAYFVVPAISVNEKQKNIDNEDAVQPFFKRDEFDNPQVSSLPDLDTLT